MTAILSSAFGLTDTVVRAPPRRAPILLNTRDDTPDYEASAGYDYAYVEGVMPSLDSELIQHPGRFEVRCLQCGTDWADLVAEGDFYVATFSLWRDGPDGPWLAEAKFAIVQPGHWHGTPENYDFFAWTETGDTMDFEIRRIETGATISAVRFVVSRPPGGDGYAESCPTVVTQSVGRLFGVHPAATPGIYTMVYP